MTRKHFVVLAKQIKQIPDLSARRQAAQAVAAACIEVSSSFDSARFYAACGV